MFVLVTGGGGFIGSNLVKTLLTNNFKVRVLDNFSTGKRENLKSIIKDIELIEGDIRSYHTVQKAIRGVDVILHQAALPSVPRSINDPITTNEVNVGGTLNILDVAKEFNVKRIVFASSSSIYGDSTELPKHEKMIPNPLSPYAVSKLVCEYYLKVFYKLYGIETISLRYFNVFGPNQDPTSQYSAVIPKFIYCIKKNIQPIIFGDGTQSRDFTYVDNVVNANLISISKVMDNYGISMNVACGEQISINDLISEINKIHNKNILPIYKEPRPGDVKHSLASIELIKQKLGYEVKTNFKEGLIKTIESTYD